MMNKISISMLVLAGSFSMNASAVDLGNDFNLTLTAAALSDYRSLGVSQTQGDPTIQLQAILSHANGLYAGLWTSNVDFGTKTRMENGYYVGYAYAFNDNINATASIGRYEYPKQASFDTNEFYGEINIYKVKLGYIYDFGVDNDVPNLSSTFVGYTFDLPYETSFYVKYGHTDYNFDLYSKHGNTRQTYNDWEAKLSKTLFGVNFSVGYVDTDLSKAECMSSMGVDDVCSGAVVVGASKSF